MRAIILAATFAAALTAASTASAGERTLTGAAIGGGIGAVVAGPPGAVVGGAIGAYVGGPKLTHHHHCWRSKRGVRHCHYH